MDTAFWFPIVKVVHLGSLVLWLGPSGGAWLVLMLGRRELGEPGTVTDYLYRGFLRLLWIEHLGLLLMLASGTLMLAMYGLSALDAGWLRVKLLMVFGIIVPIEIADMWFSHRRLPEIFASREAGAPYTAREQRILFLYHRRFTPIVLPVLLVTIVVIMWLAVAKPA